MNKRSTIFLFILVIIIALGFVVYQIANQEIQIEKVDAGIDIKSKNNMIVDLDVYLKSPFFWDTEIKSMDYKVRLADEVLVDGSENYDSLLLKPSISKIPLQIQVDPQQINNTISSIQDQDSTQIMVDYELVYRIPIFGTGDFEKKMISKIPVPIPPEFILEDISFDNLVIGEPTVATINMTLINRGFIDLTINHIDYRVMVEGDEWALGNRDKPIEVESRSTSNFTLQIELDPENLGDRLWQKFIDGEPVQYGVYITAGVDLPVERVNVQQLQIKLENTY